MNKVLSVGLIIILALCYSCKEDENIIEVNKVEITPATLSIVEGINQQLTVKILPENATDRSIVWTSSDETIATVSDEGLVVAVKEGECNVLATSKNKIEVTCKVSVKKITINLNLAKLELKEGETKQVTSTISPEGAYKGEVVWTSSDDKIASVSNTGLITAVKEGACDIIASLNNGEKATCAITISAEAVQVSSITTSAKKYTVKVGESIDLGITILPADATDKKYSFTALDNKKVTFEDGKLKGLEVGTTKFSLTALDGSDVTTGTIDVDVTASVEDVKVALIATEIEYILKINSEVSITPLFMPTNATDKSFKIVTFDKDLISVKGNVIKGIKTGTGHFYVMALDGSYESSVEAIIKVVNELPKPEDDVVNLNGKKYRTSKINGLTWMVENYAYLPSVYKLQDFSVTEARQYVYGYNGTRTTTAKWNPSYDRYGALYNHKAAVDLAPEGWRLPTNEEVIALEIAFGMSSDDANDCTSTDGRGTIAKKFMANDRLWLNNNGTNESNLSMIPGGQTKTVDSVKEWYNASKIGGFWTSSDDTDSKAYARIFDGSKDSIVAASQDKSNGFSVRYVKK